MVNWHPINIIPSQFEIIAESAHESFYFMYVKVVRRRVFVSFDTKQAHQPNLAVVGLCSAFRVLTAEL